MVQSGEIQRVLDGVPDYQAFLTVDELSASTRLLAERPCPTV